MKKLKINSFRTASASVIACAVMAIMLRLQTHKIQEILAKLAEKGKLENVSWLVKYAGYCLPVVPVVIVLAIFYSIFKGDKVTVHKEQTIVSLVLIAFTYAILLPIIASNKEPIGESEKTMLDITVNWFAVQIVPFLIMLLYHSSMTEGDVVVESPVNDSDKSAAQEGQIKE